MSHRILNRRTALKSSLAVAAAPALIGSANAQTKVTWKVQAHWPKASSSFKDSLEVFAAELDRRTGGRFKMQLFGAGELAKDRDIVLYCASGARSAYGQRILRQLGFSRVRNAGGLADIMAEV